MCSAVNGRVTGTTILLSLLQAVNTVNPISNCNIRIKKMSASHSHSFRNNASLEQQLSAACSSLSVVDRHRPFTSVCGLHQQIQAKSQEEREEPCFPVFPLTPLLSPPAGMDSGTAWARFALLSSLVVVFDCLVNLTCSRLSSVLTF